MVGESAGAKELRLVQGKSTARGCRLIHTEHKQFTGKLHVTGNKG